CRSLSCSFLIVCFFLNDPSPPAIYTLSLHDALPIFGPERQAGSRNRCNAESASSSSAAHAARSETRSVNLAKCRPRICGIYRPRDRKSTRLNSSHSQISYAVFCLKKKKKNKQYNHNK